MIIVRQLHDCKINFICTVFLNIISYLCGRSIRNVLYVLHDINVLININGSYSSYGFLRYAIILDILRFVAAKSNFLGNGIYILFLCYVFITYIAIHFSSFIYGFYDQSPLPILQIWQRYIVQTTRALAVYICVRISNWKIKSPDNKYASAMFARIYS